MQNGSASGGDAPLPSAGSPGACCGPPLARHLPRPLSVPRRCTTLPNAGVTGARGREASGPPGAVVAPAIRRLPPRTSAHRRCLEGAVPLCLPRAPFRRVSASFGGFPGAERRSAGPPEGEGEGGEDGRVGAADAASPGRVSAGRRGRQVAAGGGRRAAVPVAREAGGERGGEAVPQPRSRREPASGLCGAPLRPRLRRSRRRGRRLPCAGGPRGCQPSRPPPPGERLVAGRPDGTCAARDAGAER